MSIYFMVPKVQEIIEDSIIKNAIIPPVSKGLDKVIVHIENDASKVGLKKLFKNKRFREWIEDRISIFLNDDVKYAYILYFDKNGKIRYLADFSKEDRASYWQPFNALGDTFKRLREKQETVVIKQSDYTGLWITLIKPIREKGTVKGAFVIDFSIKKLKEIQGILDRIREFILAVTAFIVFSILISIYQFIRYKKDIKKMYIDPLTGVCNRLFMYENLDSIKKYPYTVMVIDIDFFKRINDTYGHDVGDYVLKEVAKRLKSCIREDEDILIRYGGEEFLLFIRSNPLSEDYRYKIIQLANRIKNEVSRNVISYNKIKMKVTVSIGISLYRENIDIDQAIKRADMALYRAKQNGRNRVEVYDKGLEANDKGISVIKEAIDHNGVVCWYQPIYNLRTGKVVKFESLVRIVSKDGKLIYPHQFLNSIRRTYVHVDLTKKVIEYNIKTLLDNPNMRISMNLSALDIYNDDIVDYLDFLIINKKLASRLTIEILESEDIEDYSYFKEKIMRIKDIGCSIGIDDFGTGYSNFAHIVELHPEFLKIDGSLIKDIDINPRSIAIVKAIKYFADELGIDVIAEYIHSEYILKKVIKMGIIYGQGYYLKEPIPIKKSA
ncbi:diguanylate cyclase (GGDEF) domain-containing protein [Persephonella hydrogeniphila]|uniref:Diguanylate cyclase (GGDEF) domain-containing protein n=2 Tax=Persephonella hydrogeniphila TaxID=198703 RepID=A0A285NB50_9AQUI|nr:diguanylate cyclase (GGDEF) domain-containing protein [Persephonella hydrogeniphila]